MSMYKELDRLIADCKTALSEDPPGLRQKVVARYMTMFDNTIFETTGTSIKRTASPNDVDLTSIEMILHMLQAHRDKLEYDMEMAKAKAAQVSASAATTVTVTVTVDQAISQVQSSQLGAKDKEKLELLLSGIERSAKEKDEGKTIERVKEALDIAGKATGLVPAVLQAAGSVASFF